VSDPEARHSRNIAVRPQVAIVISDSNEAGGWKAVYVSATAGEVTGADVERGIELFNRKSRRRCGIYVLRFSNIKSSGPLKRANGLEWVA
jgi:hypothetical protein